jgi:hypothetical protein
MEPHRRAGRAGEGRWDSRRTRTGATSALLPEDYIVALPFFGTATEVIPVLAAQFPEAALGSQVG